MYIELKTGFNDNGPAWIGRVRFSKTGRTVYYRGRTLRRKPYGGGPGNYYDVETGEEFWVSGVNKDAQTAIGPGVGLSMSMTMCGTSTNVLSASDRRRLLHQSRSWNISSFGPLL